MKEHLHGITKPAKVLIIFVVLAYFLISPFTSFAYDEMFYFQYFRWVYLYSVQPYYLWVFGAFYNAINVGSLSLNLPFYVFGLDNVIVQQFTVKLPMVIAAVVTGYGLIKILDFLDPGIKTNGTPFLIFMLLPITIFDVALFGNPLIIAIAFLVMSIFSLLKSRPKLSSILLAASAATYLYPIFFILPMLKVIYRNHGKKETVFSFALFILFFSLGQGLPLAVSLFTGTPLSTTILAPFFNLPSSVTVTSTTQSIWSPYFMIYSLIGLSAGAITKEVVFVLAMSIPMLIFLIEKNSSSFSKFIDFLFIESVMYVIFAITAEPQYLLAIAPFSVLLYYNRGSLFQISFLTFITLLDVVMFFFYAPLLYFYSNLHPAYGYFPRISSVPHWIEILVSSSYVASLLIYLGLFIKDSNRKDKENKGEIVKDGIKFARLKKFFMPKYTVVRGILLILIVLSLTLAVSIPYLHEVPENMYFSEQASSESFSIAPYKVMNDEVVYYANVSGSYHLLDGYAKMSGEYYLYIPPFQLNFSREAPSNVSFSPPTNSSFSVTISPSLNPAVVDQPVTFYTKVYGGVAPFTYSWYGGGNQHSANETASFYSPGNWSVEVVVTDADGNVAKSTYTERVLYDYYVFFNSHYLGGFISSSSHVLQINPIYIRGTNYLKFTGYFPSNLSISLILRMPLNVPPYILIENMLYLEIGIFSGAISLTGTIYVINRLKT